MKTFTVSFCRVLAIFILLVAITAPSFASGDPVVKANILNGNANQISVDSTVTVVDSNLIGNNYTAVNKVSLMIDEASRSVISGSFAASVSLHIKAFQSDNSLIEYDTTLTINYEGGSVYAQEHAFYFKNAFKVEAKVTSKSTNVGWNVWPLLIVTNEISSIASYTFSCTLGRIDTVSNESLSSSTGNDQLIVSWPNRMIADEYDLEWTYVDSSALASGVYGTAGNYDIPALFENNASRVTVTGTTYKIPLIYDSRGTLFFRVRSAQLTATGGRFEADWSTQQTSLGVFAYDGHERKLNWQATTTFAEEGKRKSVVQYYDGSLRNRQTVTKDNSTDSTIVAESFYDRQGRPVIQVLPSPSLSDIIKYNQNFNTGINGDEYTVDNYDILNGSAYCAASADSMSVNSGASQYYSSSNPRKNTGNHRFIPDAKKYPFSETQYLQDNTGRIAKQSGVGPVHQLGSGHETVYYYGTPSQEELDALFGTEAGDRSHYFKNMVRDANGQYSVSYVDMHGRTVATALAGKPTAALDTLSSYLDQSITETLSDSNSSVIKDLTMESKKGILVARAGSYTFNYHLDPNTFSLASCTSTICYDCLYDLQISISGDCNNAAFGGQPFDTLVKNFSLSGIDSVCNGTGFNLSFIKYLPEGSYEVTKQLSVSKYGIDYYRDSIFAVQNLCRSMESFVTEQRSLRPVDASCIPDCQSCITSIGNWNDFRNSFLAQSGIQTDTMAYTAQAWMAYNEALDNCSTLCDSLVNDADDIRSAMLADMTPPSGQYATISSDPYSALRVRIPSDTWPRYTSRQYFDEEGRPDSVYDEAVGKFVGPQDLSSEAFSAKFKDSWAESLLPLHPEYCRLQKYLDLKGSLAWDRRFEKTDTYADALARGYLNPINSNYSARFTKYGYWATGTHPDQDPLSTFVGHDYLSDLQDQLNSFGDNTTNPNHLSMWSYATLSTMCPHAENDDCYDTYSPDVHAFNPDFMCPGDLDMAWRLFRQMYLEVKRKLVANELATCAGAPTVQQLLDAHHQPHFGGATQVLTASGITIPTSQTEADNQKQANIAAMESVYDSTCRAYSTQWLDALKSCNYSTSAKDTIISRLVQVCKEGSDIAHPYGSSSAAPGSTYTFSSFEEVIDNYNVTHGITSSAACSADNIVAPKPYNQQTVYTTKPIWSKPDSCECSNITNIHQQYSLDSAAYSGFSDYLQKKFQTSISDSVLTSLLNMCTGTSESCLNLKVPIALPALFQCYSSEVCASCDRIDTLYKSFTTKYPDITPLKQAMDSTKIAGNLLFQKYMNNHLGFNKTTDEYLDFLQNCHITVPDNFPCDTLRKWLSDYRHYFGRTPHLDADGMDISHFRPNYGGIDYTLPLPLKDIVSHGYVKIPDSITTLPGYAGIIDWDYYDTICVDTSGFDFEFRAKLPDSLVRANFYKSNFWFLIDTDDFNVGSVQGSFVYDDAAGSIGFCLHATEPENGKDCIAMPGPAVHFNDFRTVRLRFRGRSCKFYVDGVFLAERTLNAPFTRITALTITSFSIRPIIDYYRIIDINGNYLLNEEFNLASDMAVAVKKCSSDCDQGFSDYFNQVSGKQYSEKQVSDLYFNSCGLYYNPNCISDSLSFIQDEFKNLYYNQGKKFDQDGYDSTTYKVTPGSAANTTGFSHKEIFKNGIFQFPDTLGKAPFPDHIALDKSSFDSACVDGNMSIEYRMRFPKNLSETKHQMTFQLYFTPTEKYYINWDLLNSANSYVHYDFPSIPGGDTTVFNIPELNVDLTNWKIVKFEMKDSLFRIYIDGSPVRTFIFPRSPNRMRFLTHQFECYADKNMSTAIDWIKAYDGNNNLFYNEDFVDLANFKTYGLPAKCAQIPYLDAFTEYYNSKNNTAYTTSQIDSIYSNANIPLAGQNSISTMLCGSTDAVIPPVDITQVMITNCSDSSFFIYSNATELYQTYTDSLKGSFDKGYRERCLQAYKFEDFSVTHQVSEFHYTLYYYDQAGNLVKTIPPKGVQPNRNSSWLSQIKSLRASGGTQLPSHTMPTQYRYNTLNQVVTQQTPDAGESNFWYDILGRLALSQNARQKAASATAVNRLYSYTQYDDLGRITEVGQVRDSGQSTIVVDDALTRDKSALQTWFYAHAYNRGQITSTVYDVPYKGFDISDDRLIVKQKNLRNRVSYSSYADTMGTSAFSQATFYSYDIHGNVDTVLQDYGVTSVFPSLMNSNGNRYKKISYNYDLISGKVNKVAYQQGWADQVFFKYSYDAENRLVTTETSFDNRHWERDARYEYYRHGPLARMILGAQQVQGVDYAYTLQGWMAGMNSTILDSSRDMGEDGLIAGIHQYIGRDVIGLNLNYFTADYVPINSSVTPFPAAMGYLGSGEYRPLYNGNISSIAENNRALNNAANVGSPLMFYNYRYDQLNRLVAMDAYKKTNLSANSWSDLTAVNFFKERINYDANGNILKYLRNGHKASNLMDSLTYSYNSGMNQLNWIRDQVPANTYGMALGDVADIDNQSSDNYGYDEIGNLVKDDAEGITSIKWSVYGKILEIDKTTTASNPVSKIRYTYDAQGNRISKVVEKNNGINVYTSYVRDAQGNVLATYGSSGSGSDLSALPLNVTERHLYGSSRLGIYSATMNVDNGPKDMTDSNSTKYWRGYRQYELPNHLGNVLATITDKKKPVYASGAVSYYDADVTTAQDYYPFGMQMPGRIGYQSQGGWVSEPGGDNTGDAVLADIAFHEPRENNLPQEYTATNSIEFTPGFESENGDTFLAYISFAEPGGGSGGSGEGSLNNGYYRYGFNGKENDNEIKGVGNQQDYGMRIYDPRLGRFLSTDPLTNKYPELTPYQFASDRPIDGIDLDGLEYIRAVPNFQYDGSVWDIPAAIDNGVINVVNTIPGIWNSGVDNFKSIKRGTYFNDLSKDVKQTAQGIKKSVSDTYKYSVNTPGKQQLWDMTTSLASPQTLEEIATVGFSTYLGGNILKAQNKGLGVTNTLSKTASANSGVLTIPQGVTAEEFQALSQRVVNTAGNLSDDIVVQGSRAAGTASISSDLDIAIKVSPKEFDRLISERFGTPNPGSAFERTKQHAVKTGKIQAGEAGLSNLRKTLKELIGKKVDISIIKIGGQFDNGSQIPIKKK